MRLLYRHPSWKDSYYIHNGQVCDHCDNRKKFVFGSHSQHFRRSLLTPVIQVPKSELSNNSVTLAKCNDDLDHPNHSTDIPTCTSPLPSMLTPSPSSYLNTQRLPSLVSDEPSPTNSINSSLNFSYFISIFICYKYSPHKQYDYRSTAK